MTAVVPCSKAGEAIRRKARWRTHDARSEGGTTGSGGRARALSSTVRCHWRCSLLSVAEPSMSALILVKLSTTEPTKRLITVNVPSSSHRIQKAAAGEKSLRSGATPAPTASMLMNMKSSQPSPVAAMKRMSIAEPKSSNEPKLGLSHSAPARSHASRSGTASSVHAPKASMKSSIPTTAKATWKKSTAPVTEAIAPAERPKKAKMT